MSSRHTSAAHHPGVAQFHTSPARTVVHVPKDAALSALLRAGTGGLSRQGARALSELATAAHPPAGVNAPVTFYGNDAQLAAEAVAVLLAKARTEGHPAADALAGVAGQLGVHEPEPEPASTPVSPRQALREKLEGA